MTRRGLIVGAVCAVMCLAVVLSVVTAARAQGFSAERLRFRVVGDEPIAAPDGRSTVAGMKVIVVRDTKSDQCYVTFISGSAMSTTGPSVCP